MTVLKDTLVQRAAALRHLPGFMMDKAALLSDPSITACYLYWTNVSGRSFFPLELTGLLLKLLQHLFFVLCLSQVGACIPSYLPYVYVFM